MDKDKKPKSGFMKRKEKEKWKMEEAANDPRQAKVRKFFQSSSVISTKNQNEDSAECEDATVNEATNQPVISQGESTIHNEPVIATSSGTGYVAEKFNESDPVNSTSMNISNEKVYRPATTSVLPTGSTPKIFEFENDKGLYDIASGISLNVDQIRALLLTGPCQPKECDMPGGEFKQSSDKRRFNSSFYYKNKKKPFMEDNYSPWLSYSPTKNYAYCHYCWLFGDEIAKKSIWYVGFTDWKHCHQSATQHSLSKAHLSNAVAAATFLQKNDIRHKLEQQISEEAKKWHAILNILFDTVKTLSGLGVGFRGHRENLQKVEHPGIYLSIIKLISRHNPILHAHLESPERIKYLSKTITYELLSTLADQTRKFIVDECKGAKFFTFIADSTTDIAHLDQMAILLRYIVIQNEGSTASAICIKESFLCFVQLTKGDATSICNIITAILFDKYGFQKKYLSGQAYDGAAVMSGREGGLQAKMKEYVGDVNLVLVHAAEENASSSIKVFFAIIQRIYNYFAHSHRRWDELLEASKNPSRNSNSFGIQLLKDLKKEIFESDADTEDGLSYDEAHKSRERVLHIKGLSTTRWAARIKAMEAFIQNFECIVDCLEKEISRDAATGDDIMTAQSLLSSLNCVAQIQLQKKELNLITAQHCTSAALKKMRDLRDESAYNNFITKARSQWGKMSLERADFPVARKRKIKKMPGENSVDCVLETPDKHRASYYEVLDTMCCELQDRANGFKEINNVFGFLMPEILHSMKPSDFETSTSILLEKYTDFFTTDLKHELSSFADLYFAQQHDSSNDSPLQYLGFIVKHNLMDSFPECCSLFRLYLTLPVTTASAERGMNSLKRIKEYRRATLAEETLNDFSILYIEKAVANKIDLYSTIEIFAEQKARRGFKTT
ncbi:uncharacterized protein LOC122403525 [Colletes gigas]|uniref:uncharacterized protein LOC122403525 n=1 Tax=Colletes gigas TaxID=935657 RepID=UPI001C9B8418|nr:uncharacterized protein LOC122403525 [Colletes gigas]